MTSQDPFLASGYARLDENGRLWPVPLEEAQRLAGGGLSYLADRDHAADSDRCFLCGARLDVETRTREHVFPRWLLRDLELWQERMTLLNGTTIPYASLTVPSCRDCNSYWMSKVENQIAAAFRAGPDAVAEIDQTTLVLWMAKLYYGIHFKEVGLAADRRDPGGPRILSPGHLRDNLGALHHLMQALRGRARFSRPPGSLVVLRTQRPVQPKLRFDYRDSLSVAFLAIRIGSTGVLASLLDWGVVVAGVEIKSVEIAKRLDLHPLQFREAAAAFGYAAMKFDREFVYSIQPQGDHDLIQPLIVQQADSQPVSTFGTFDAREAAEGQAAFMGLPLDDIFDAARQQTWTCLHDESGVPELMSLEHFPAETQPITPLRAARDARDTDRRPGG